MAVATNKLTDTTGIQLNRDAFVVIIKTEWNAHVTDVLEEGCIKVLDANNISHKTLLVPGAFEIPFTIHKYWQVLKETEEDDLLDEDFLVEIEKIENYTPKEIHFPDAFIALGCVIKGDTPHFEYVCQGVTQGMMHLNTTLPVPILNGILTVHDQMQADERTGGRNGHKGEECAAAAIKMIALSQSL
jgi:6,7-dimethyl-8-ribityllumazine synthase